MKRTKKIGFGGGCHWCTEAVFQSLKGVYDVKQGWIASDGEGFAFSEAVIVAYDATIIPLEILIEVHLRTHKSTSEHSMRKKYRSAIYVYDEIDQAITSDILEVIQPKFSSQLVTQVLLFSKFKPSRDEIANYYYKNPQKPFCETFINPKLKLLLNEFSDYAKIKDLQHINQGNYEHKI